MENLLKGKKGEQLAEDLLSSKGIKILHKNWRKGKNEVDIIAKDKDFTVFVEVKTRSTRHFGNPTEMVSKKQRINILKAANIYCLENTIEILSIRFDIVSILDTGIATEAEHIEDAFYPFTNQIKNFSC